MKQSNTFRSILKQGNYYHIHNRASGGALLFADAENYRFFIDKWESYLGPYVDVYAYCLMPDRFHFLVKVKEGFTSDDMDEGAFVREQFRRLFISYTHAYNRYWNRVGGLFRKGLEVHHIRNAAELSSLISYINSKPVLDKYVRECNQWRYSSYNALLVDKPTRIKRKKVLKLFGGRDRFLQSHRNVFYAERTEQRADC